ncbi:pyrroline-5-carboxylate reductase [Falsirhodobacter sp. alg1]|uniref:pyrroline-5-carboxylate reductase n=1 Tax=Falsirhodobacter sp. alg1 TaxID=1472418 RepID=UPI0005EE94DF|nr:pyrroline-5-carboxylate reductase [Falsirhodobacter sp. alg1]
MTQTPFTCLFIGCGNMGSAIAAGLVATRPEVTLHIVDRHPERVQSRLPDNADAVIVPAIADLPEADYAFVIIAIKPQYFAQLDLAGLKTGENTIFVSIMAGVTTPTLAAQLGTPRVVRTMPNLPAMVGEGMTIGYAPPALDWSDRSLIQHLFEGVGKYLWMDDEGGIDHGTGVAGSGPGYVFAIAQYMVEAAMAQGFDKASADLVVRQTLYGTSKMLLDDPRDAADLKRAVTSPNGTTQAGLAVLEMPEALPKLMREAVAAAADRSAVLGGLK